MSEQTAKKNNIKTSKLIQLLEVLSPLELKRFKKFLESPFHNSNELLVQLYNLLKKYHPTYDAPQLTKEKLFAKLFKKQPYRQKRMNDLMYDLRQLVEDFLIVSHTLDEKEERTNVLVKVLGRRNHHFFREESEKLIQKINSKKTYLVGEDYLRLQQLYDGLWFHVNTPKNQGKSTSFEKAHENLDLFFVLTKLQYFAEQEGRKRIFKEMERTTFLNEILNFVTREKINTPLLYFFEQIINIAKGDFSEEKYLAFKKKVLLDGFKIKKELRRDILTHLSNYCIQRNNRGEIRFLKEALDIYKIMDINNLLVIDGNIGDAIFLNISNFAIKCGENRWAKEFRKKHQVYLDDKIAEETINIADIYDLFYQNNFKEANRLINKVKLNRNSTYYPGIRVHLMKGLYNDWCELSVNNSETLLDQATAFEKSIQRNKIFSNEKVKSYLNFTKYFKHLIKLKKMPRSDSDKVNQLKRNVKNEDSLTFKSWLLEKIESLEK